MGDTRAKGAPGDLIPGTLDMLILKTLNRGAMHGYSIAQISDIHVGPTIKQRYLERIVESVNRIKPDLVAITGDLVDGSVAELNDAANPAVLALIARAVAAARKRGVEVSLCGDAAADTRLTTALLATGLTSLSVAPVSVARLKAVIEKIGS